MPIQAKNRAYYSTSWINFISTALLTVTCFSIFLYASFTLNVDQKISKAYGQSIATVINNDGFSNVNPIDLCTTNNLKCYKSNTVSYLSDGVKNDAPPSNKSYSSAVFTGKLDGLHLFPNIIRSDVNNGLNLGFGERWEGENWVSHTLNESYVNVVGAEKATKLNLNNASPFSSSFDMVAENGKKQYALSAVQGSPFTYFIPYENKLTINLNNFKVENYKGRTVLKQNNSNTYYAVFSSAIQSISGNRIDFDFTFSPVKYLTLGYMNDINLAIELEKYAGNVVTSTKTEFLKTDTEFLTKYEFIFTPTSPNNLTLFGLLPHQWDNIAYQQSYLYETTTLRGKQKFLVANKSLNLNTIKEAILEDLPLDLLTVEEKTQVILEVKDETKNLSIWNGGSYYGAKNVAKAARLLQIANQLGLIEEKNFIQDLLKRTLESWFTLENKDEWWKIFKYDTNLKSIFATPEEFGNEQEINDHHFHYGQIIFASSVLAKYDNSFKNNFKPFINVLIRDIASPSQVDKYFPFLRSFDIYEGHSWASGMGKFRNGNNQESTSEAIFAWYGIWNWGLVIEDDNLKDLGHYLYSAEINSTNYYWLGRGKTDNIFKQTSNYKYSTASLVWGGAYVFDTWFSNDPLAIKGIQYLPMTAGASYLQNTTRINEEYEEVKKISNLETRNSDWADLNLMYYALAKGKEVRSNLSNVYKNISIDNGNTRSNFLSWIYFWDKVKGSTKKVSTDYSYYKFNHNGTDKVLLNCTTINAIGNCKKGSQIINFSNLVPSISSSSSPSSSSNVSSSISNALSSSSSLISKINSSQVSSSLNSSTSSVSQSVQSSQLTSTSSSRISSSSVNSSSSISSLATIPFSNSSSSSVASVLEDQDLVYFSKHIETRLQCTTKTFKINSFFSCYFIADSRILETLGKRTLQLRLGDNGEVVSTCQARNTIILCMYLKTPKTVRKNSFYIKFQDTNWFETKNVAQSTI